jgi:hypothetical protein
MTSRALAVNLEAEDRGLLTCLVGARLDQAYVLAFIAKYRLETLDDFVHYVNKDDKAKAIAELDAMVEAVPASKDSGIHRSRVRAAWTAGCEAIQLASNHASKGVAEDFDQPIPDGTLRQLQKDWDSFYRLVLEPYVDPCDALRGRTWREFKQKKPTAQELKKVKSILQDKSAQNKESVELPGGIQLQFDREQNIVLNDVISAYYQLRTLANAWAFCGTGQVPSQLHKGTQVQGISLSQALAYADDALRFTIEYGSGDVGWLLKRDLQTRAKMATLIRREFPPGEALQEALREMHADWHSHFTGTPRPARVDDEGGCSPSRKRQRSGRQGERDHERLRRFKEEGHRRPAERDSGDRGSGDRGARGGGGAGTRTVSMFKGNVRVCKNWNDGRGCKGSCGCEHACDVINQQGKACQSKSHTRMNHDPRKHG